ncbi:MAG: Ig-like domain-containing protein, partial [Clostridia bacterium]|nr:Ig-like domain-containing protein [Clostridia bacterium]
MKNRKWFSLISFVLSVLMLLGALPMGALAAYGGEADYRGTMSADENGVMIYDALSEYLVKSVKDQVLLADYETQASSAANSKVSVATVDTRYPDPVVEMAIYYDKSIEGTTPVVRYGLSEIDHVTYVDSATGAVTEGAAPKALTASNGGDATFGGGFGTNQKGETTTHYASKSILVYIINHNCHERIGTESDVSILTDYIEEGYVVVVLDYKNQASAITPHLELSLVSVHKLFSAGSALRAELVDEDGGVISVSTTEMYFVPEGFRLARDIWYYDPSIYGANGVMEKFVEVWNANIAGGTQDKHGIGKVASVEELVAKAKAKNTDLPIDYKYSMNIMYPSQPKDGYKAPLYIQEGTNQVRELAANAQDYRHVTLMGFALNGYATALYDHSFYPFLKQFQYDATFGYGNHYDNYNNGRAAVRCARYYADALGYSSEQIGIAGISKATIATAMLATKNNEDIQCTISGYNTKVCFGDIFLEGTDAKSKTPENRLQAIVQPFKTAADGVTEIDSDVACAYVAAGSGVTNFFGTGQYTNREMVPMVVSDGVRDEYNSYDYYEQHEDYYEGVVDVPYLMIPMMDQDHTYPIGYDDEYGYERLSAMIGFFDVHLKPDAARAPRVLWMTPVSGSTGVPVSGEWIVGPYTIYGQAVDGYEREQKIQVKFADAVSPESVSYGMVVRDASGKRIGGDWVASQNDTLYTFVTDGLKAGTTYTVTATEGIVSKNGVPLAEQSSVNFTTAGTYALYAVADTYVSSLAPDKSFGNAEQLVVEGGSIALLSYPTASLATATSVALTTYGKPDAGTSISVYALPAYKVDEAALTYNTLTASSVWADKILLGTFDTFESEQISLDLSALSKETSGDYVTLAVVSHAASVEDPYIYHNDFEEYTIGTALTGTDSTGATVTVLAANGRITDGRNELDNRIYSDYIARLGGANPQYMDLVTEEGSKALRVYGISESVKLYNSFKDSAFTAKDVGRSFRITFRVKAEKNGGLTVLVNSANKGEGGSDKFGTFTGPVSSFDSTSAVPNLRLGIKAGQWREVTHFVTVTEEMVAAQAGLLSITFPWTTWHFFAWIDDVTVTECTPTMVLAAKESDSALRPALITTNTAAVEFAAGDLEQDDPWVNENIPNVTAVSPAANAENVSVLSDITVAFDKAMKLSTLADGIAVVNETTGERVKGSWGATDGEGKIFAFTTKGFVAGCTYSVTLTEGAKTLMGVGGEETPVTRFTVEGRAAVRPLVSTYASAKEPTRHFALDIAPVIDGDRVGVLTYSAEALAGATAAKLYLPVSTEAPASLEVYAIADYTPDISFCYNTLSALTLSKIADVKTAGGTVAVEAAELAELGAIETVTLVIKPTLYTFEQNFDQYYLNVGINNQDEFGNNRVLHNGMVLSSGQYGGTSTYDENGYTTFLLDYTGTQAYAYVYKDEAIDASQILQWKTTGGQGMQFHGSLKRDYFTQDDLGRSFRVTMRIYPTVEAGCTVRFGAYSGSTQVTPAGYTPQRVDAYYSAGEATLTLNEWNDVSFN